MSWVASRVGPKRLDTSYQRRILLPLLSGHKITGSALFLFMPQQSSKIRRAREKKLNGNLHSKTEWAFIIINWRSREAFFGIFNMLLPDGASPRRTRCHWQSTVRGLTCCECPFKITNCLLPPQLTCHRT